jgi:hypothetical protein
MAVELPEYVVVDVKHAVADGTEPAGAQAPREILERFEGRTFTLGQLQQRGVRIAGGRAYYTANAADWLLELAPSPR